MATMLITKFFIPPTRAEIVRRPDLAEMLNDGLNRKLTILSAPAGFGKTTLVSHWLENLPETDKIGEQQIKVAWLSLDENDNDPARFLTYFVTWLNKASDPLFRLITLRLQVPTLFIALSRFSILQKKKRLFRRLWSFGESKRQTKKAFRPLNDKGGGRMQCKALPQP